MEEALQILTTTARSMRAMDADDCAQDVLLAALEHGRLEGKTGGYWWVAARHAVIDQARREARRHRLLERNAAEPASAQLPGKCANVLLRKVLAAVSMRQLVWLMVYTRSNYKRPARATRGERVKACRLRRRIRIALPGRKKGVTP